MKENKNVFFILKAEAAAAVSTAARFLLFDY